MQVDRGLRSLSPSFIGFHAISSETGGKKGVKKGVKKRGKKGSEKRGQVQFPLW